ncbi:MAG TPA: paraquat-inducible protein A [Burkholderiales bacterium]|nr:paraquat-inducible protein A [Burkholderiales bacterium]
MESIITCKTCGLLQRIEALQPGAAAECCRCGSVVGRHPVDSLGRTAGFSLAALILFVPANIYPILLMDFYGAYSESTVWDGCVKLFEDDQWPIATIVFLASILVPILKLLGLFFLVVSTKFRSAYWQRERTWIFKIIDVIGPWAMLDVFLLAILVALVKLGSIATVLPGRGLIAFTGMVVFTILASASFDPTLIWEKSEKKS